MKSGKHNPDQTLMPFFAPVITVTGPGTFKVELGKPILWLTAEHLHQEFHIDVKTIYRWREEWIPRFVDGVEMWRERGVRGWEFSSAVVPFIREKLKENRPV